MSKEKLVMKYEKPEVEMILTDEEDIIRTSSGLKVGSDDEEENSKDTGWSGFF